MRGARILFAIALLVAAVVLALLASDLLRWRNAIRSGDLQFSRGTADARWNAAAVLPFDPARALLGIGDQLQFRRAAQSFETIQAAGRGYDNGVSETHARGELEARLTELARSSDRLRTSEADNLLGILAFADSKQTGPSAPAPVEQSVSDFQAAVRLDPGNEEAKFNLELLLRQLVAKGSRRGSNNGPGGPARGHRGAGGGLPGRGY